MRAYMMLICMGLSFVSAHSAPVTPAVSMELQVLKTALRDPFLPYIPVQKKLKTARFSKLNRGLDINHQAILDTQISQPITVSSNAVPEMNPQVFSPAAQSTDYVYLGRIVDAEGNTSVFMQPIAQEGVSIKLTLGAQLPDGYVVQSIDADAVVLILPSLQTTMRLSLPPYPLVETR
jgi:hypothetical protein